MKLGSESEGSRQCLAPRLAAQGKMMDDKAASNQYRRPHYGDGDRLRIIQQGQYFGREGVIEGQPTPVTITQGYVLTYLYYLRLDDGTVLDLAEELLAPLAE